MVFWSGWRMCGCLKRGGFLSVLYFEVTVMQWQVDGRPCGVLG
jgi:hypothetical protein